VNDSPEAHGIAAAGAAKALHEIEAMLRTDPTNQRLAQIRQELLAEIEEHQWRMRALLRQQ
jgi:hypothetical protein